MRLHIAENGLIRSLALDLPLAFSVASDFPIPSRVQDASESFLSRYNYDRAKKKYENPDFVNDLPGTYLAAVAIHHWMWMST